MRGEYFKMIGEFKIAALCVSEVSDDSCREFITTLNEELVKYGFRLLVYCTCTDLFWNTPNEHGEQSVFELIDYENTDVMILHDEKIKNKRVKNDIYERCLEKNIPLICFGNAPEGCYSVDFDYIEGFKSVIEHVVTEHKLTDIYYMSGQRNNEFAQTRENVFKSVMAEHGIPFDDKNIYYGDFWSMPAAAECEKIIASGHIPQALICANDTMAIAACTTFMKHGYSVPEDIIITGFDGVEEIKFSHPKITSCGCNYQDISVKIAKAADMLTKGEEPPLRQFITPRLILSESCGCHFEEKFSSASYFTNLNNAFVRFKGEERILNTMSAKAQTCSDIFALSKELTIQEIYDCVCLLKRDCIDRSVNPSSIRTSDPFGEDMVVIFDTDYRDGFEPYEFKRSGVIPHFDKNLEKKMPLIFAAINSLNIPLGYICFHYNDYDSQNYNKIPQTINSLNVAIGGFRNMMYQRFLINQIEDMYKFDVLTGLYNRNGFMKLYQGIADRAAANKEQLTAVLADLDGLKKINDNFSHIEGDNAISVAADALKSACRGAVCCRLGGDELIAVFSHAECGERIKQTFTKYIDDYNANSKKPYKVSASVGVFTGNACDFTNFDRLFRNADKLMYEEKTAKKQNRIL